MAFVTVTENSDMANETEVAREAWSWVRKARELAEARPELIAWGGDASADLLCWDASGEDPGRWPVLVYDRDDGRRAIRSGNGTGNQRHPRSDRVHEEIPIHCSVDLFLQ